MLCAPLRHALRTLRLKKSQLKLAAILRSEYTEATNL